MPKRWTDILGLEYNEYNELNGLNFLPGFERKLLHLRIFKVGGKELV
jgi:hypothetical protein